MWDERWVMLQEVKIAELEEDAASSEGTPSRIKGLNQILKFCDEKSCTFFRIDFRDKQNHPEEYSIIRELDGWAACSFGPCKPI